MQTKAKILVLIPCYNEEANIVKTVERLRELCPEVDYLVINDCSTDRSAALLKEHGYEYLDLPVNLGIGGGIQCGYVYAAANGYDVTVQMDGDGQHDPAYLMQIVEPVLKGELDMCIGSRFIRHEGFQTSFMRRVGIRFLSAMIFLLCGQRVLDVTSGFRATGRAMTDYFARNYAADYPEPEASGRQPGWVPCGRSAGGHARTPGRRVQHFQLQERVLHDQGFPFADHRPPFHQKDSPPVVTYSAVSTLLF